MPKTKFQSVVFSAMMVFAMVFCMTCYTVSFNLGGFSYKVLSIAIQEMWVEYVVVFLLIFFVITKIAQKLTARIIDREAVPGFVSILAMQTFTVAIIVPVITLFATFLHDGFTGLWFVQWIELWVKCLPMAFFLQVLYVGPLVRLIFRTIFRNQNHC
ncbi:MAG: DUF2798 domain-containing protein [Lachnospiraceae bacterium]|nr:DUF2798 domain-containing protein [Lachnospiraceae bacterium]